MRSNRWDRLLSNQGIDIDAALRHWVPYVVGPRGSINVAMDWTEFDADGQATILLSLLTRHGRATPLVWLTVDTATLKNHRNEYEYQALVRPGGRPRRRTSRCVSLPIAGSAIPKLYRVLTEELKFNYRHPVPAATSWYDRRGRRGTATAAAWVGPGGRARVLRNALVTAERYQVGTVLCRAGQGDESRRGALATSSTEGDRQGC